MLRKTITATEIEHTIYEYLAMIFKMKITLLIQKSSKQRYKKSGLGTPFFSDLFRAVRYILFRSKKRMFRSFPFFSRVFGDL